MLFVHGVAGGSLRSRSANGPLDEYIRGRLHGPARGGGRLPARRHDFARDIVGQHLLHRVQHPTRWQLAHAGARSWRCSRHRVRRAAKDFGDVARVGAGRAPRRLGVSDYGDCRAAGGVRNALFHAPEVILNSDRAALPVGARAHELRLTWARAARAPRPTFGRWLRGRGDADRAPAVVPLRYEAVMLKVVCGMEQPPVPSERRLWRAPSSRSASSTSPTPVHVAPAGEPRVARRS